jgi:hypothetical protein
MKEIVQKQLALSIATLQAVLADDSIAETIATRQRTDRCLDESRR